MVFNQSDPHWVLLFTHLFLWFQPGISVLYCVPEPKEPGLPQTNSATHQVKQVFAFPLHLENTARIRPVSRDADKN